MSQELIQANPNGNLPAPFAKSGLPASVNAGAVSIESERAIAEAKGQMQLAKMFPRDNNAAYAELMDACKLQALARVAFYAVPRAGGTVSGPSIRLAEEIARIYGNFQYGHRELARDSNKSEVEVFAWDVERNNRSIRQITVEHTRDTKDGPKKLRDQKDIDDKIANVASKQVRGRILALLPKWMVEAAIEECKATLAGQNDEPISVRVRKMTQAFSKFGVTAEHLERYLGHNLDGVMSDEIVDLTGIFNSIKEGTPPSDFFGASEAAEQTSKTAEAITKAAEKGKATATASKKPNPEPTQKPDAQQVGEGDSKPVKTDSKPVEATNQQETSSPASPAQTTDAAEPEDVF